MLDGYQGEVQWFLATSRFDYRGFAFSRIFIKFSGSWCGEAGRTPRRGSFTANWLTLSCDRIASWLSSSQSPSDSSSVSRLTRLAIRLHPRSWKHLETYRDSSTTRSALSKMDAAIEGKGNLGFSKETYLGGLYASLYWLCWT